MLLPGFPDLHGAFCTCTDFAKRGIGTCKHLEAAAIWLEENPEEVRTAPRTGVEAPRDLWPEIDRRLRGRARSRLPTPLRVRLPGEALLVE